jgi:hypothetical protein
VKRIVLFALAVLLTAGALVTSKPAYACVANPECYTNADCDFQCPDGGTCSVCRGLCICFA